MYINAFMSIYSPAFATTQSSSLLSEHTPWVSAIGTTEKSNAAESSSALIIGLFKKN